MDMGTYRANPPLFALDAIMPRRSGFRTTTGVHLHTGFKMRLRCDPSVVRGLWRRTEERTPCQETLTHSDRLCPPQTPTFLLILHVKERQKPFSLQLYKTLASCLCLCHCIFMHVEKMSMQSGVVCCSFFK